MKLHLPCALRGALFACFALACAAPALASTISIDGTSDTYYLNSGDSSYTLTPANNSIAMGISIETLNVCDSATLNIGSADSSFYSIEINNILVADQQDLNIVVADNTTLYLNNVNFTGNVTYTLGAGSSLYVSADDCVKGGISGSGTVYFTGGVLNATSVNLSNSALVYWCSGSAYTSGGFMASELSELASPYSASGSAISYYLPTNGTVSFNVSAGSGSVKYDPLYLSYQFTWDGAGTRINTTTDSPSIIIDKDSDVFRNRDDAGNLYWNLSKTVSVQTLKGGTLACAAENTLAAMEDSDTLLFAGGELTSDSDVTISNPFAVDGTSKVILSPDAGVTMTVTEGESALSNGNGLALRGGSGSTVALENVETSAPTGIVFASENTTLAISGPETLTMDDTQNTFLSSSKLSKLDGGTLNYVAGDSAAIGSLINSSGTVSIGSMTALAVSSIEAGTLLLDTDGAIVNAGTVSVGNITLSDYTDYGVILNATSLEATGTVKLGQGALLTGTNLSVPGTVSISGMSAGSWMGGELAIGNISVTAPDGGTATVKGLDFSAGSLAASSVDNAVVSVTMANARAASASATATLSLGVATNTLIQAASGTTLADTVLAKSTVIGSGSLTMSGTTHGTNSTVAVTGTGSTLTLANTTLMAGGSITVGATDNGDGTVSGGSTYTLSENVLFANQFSGTVKEDKLIVSNIRVDMTNLTDPIETPIALFEEGAVAVDASSITFRRAPGIRCTLVTLEDGSTAFTSYDASAEIMQELSTNSNISSMADVLVSGATTGTGGVIKDLYDFVRNESDYEYSARLGALEALASGSITMLADSQRQAVGNTINRLRNRVVQMGNPQGIEPEKKVHAWIEADTNYNDIDQDGGYAGYEYQTWGGTVGAHMDVGDFSFGAAISASYGELTSHSSDRAEGDHDSYSVSAFARHQSGNWTQMGILSVGRNEMDITRYVNDYVANGETSGFTVTAYYEAGYSISLNENNTQVLQPLVSVMFTTARMDAFSETGTIGNAGLNSDTEDYMYGTVGIGARYQVVLGQNAYERVSFLELRAKVVQDFGDETDELSVSFSGIPGQNFTLRGADVSRTGFQLGAGVSIPVGAYTTIFADVDADIRSGATGVGGSIGLRYEF